MLYNRSQQILCRKEISMLASLKVSSLADKYVLYTPEPNAKGGLNFEGFAMQK